MSKRILPLIAALCVAGCAQPKPVLYPTPFYKERSPDTIKADIADCETQAKAFVKTNKSKIVAKRTWMGAVFGAIIGVVWGAFTGNFGRAIAEGAAVGAAAGLVHGAYDSNTPDGVYMRFTDYCLAQKGYQPLGWK
jgi:membrane associated rhomboid family serine protease